MGITDVFFTVVEQQIRFGNFVAGVGTTAVDFVQSGVSIITTGAFTEQTQTSLQQRELARQDVGEFAVRVGQFVVGASKASQKTGAAKQKQQSIDAEAKSGLTGAVTVLLVIAAIRVAMAAVTTVAKGSALKFKLGFVLATTAAGVGLRWIVVQSTPGGGPQPFGLGQGFMQTDNRFPTRWQDRALVAVPDTTTPGHRAVDPGEVYLPAETVAFLKVHQQVRWCRALPTLCRKT